MAGLLPRYMKKSVMGNTYLGDDSLSIGSHFSIKEDILYIDGISTGMNFRGTKGEKGDSAYDIAVANGFEGTVSEWLKSLIPEVKSEHEKAVEAGLFEGSEKDYLF